MFSSGSLNDTFTRVCNSANFIPTLTCGNINASSSNLISDFKGPSGATGATGATGTSKGFSVVFGANVDGNNYLIFNGSYESISSPTSEAYKTRFYLPVNAILYSYSYITHGGGPDTQIVVIKNDITNFSQLNVAPFENEASIHCRDLDTPISFNKGDYCAILQMVDPNIGESTITLYFDSS
jgi:hypothetical protein